MLLNSAFLDAIYDKTLFYVVDLFQQGFHGLVVDPALVEDLLQAVNALLLLNKDTNTLHYPFFSSSRQQYLITNRYFSTYYLLNSPSFIIVDSRDSRRLPSCSSDTFLANSFARALLPLLDECFSII